MSTACASRKQRSVGIGVAVGVGEARERLGADDAAGGEVDDRLEGDVEPEAVDQALHARADALAALRVERRALLVRAGALALGDEVRGQLVLELAQLLGDGDEADQQADGGHRELAGAQREARPPGALERPARRDDVGERVERRERPSARARTCRPRTPRRRRAATRGRRRRPARSRCSATSARIVGENPSFDARSPNGVEATAAQARRRAPRPPKMSRERSVGSHAGERDARRRRAARGARSGSARRRRRRSGRPAPPSGNRLGSANSVSARPISASVVPTDIQASRPSPVAFAEA